MLRVVWEGHVPSVRASAEQMSPVQPEAKARKNIDRQLEQSGWLVQDYRQMNISAGPGVAIREFPLSTGEADYLLYADGRAIGVVEAKPEGHSLTGVETQSGKYLDGLPTRFNISCNELPLFGDPTGSLSARMLILPYKRSFSGREDRELKERLLTEISGISNWALVGLARLKKQGRFTECEGMLEKTRQFRRNNSDAFAFTQDLLIVERRIDPGNLEGVRMSDEPQSCTAAELSSAYQSWRSGEGRSVGDVRWLCRSLAAVLPDLENRRLGKAKTMTYYGIGIAKE
jgi:hypothetical protein